jgi:adenine-specific DNA-methyltransferase
MARKAKPPTGKKSVETIRHAEAKRRNIPTAEYQSVIQKEADTPLRVA